MKVAGLAGAKVIVVVELTDLARDLADLPPLQAVLRVEYRPGTTICASARVVSRAPFMVIALLGERSQQSRINHAITFYSVFVLR